MAELVSSESQRVKQLVPLSAAQEVLLLAHEIAPQGWAYNVVLSSRCRTEVDVPALEQALRNLVQRHPRLRATIARDEGVPAQRIHQSVPVALLRLDASAWTGEELQRRALEQARKPFDLTRQAHRFVLFSKSAADHVLLLVFHHVFVDPMSLGVLLNDLGHLYAASSGRVEPGLSPARASAAVPPGPEHRPERSEVERLRAFWERELAGTIDPVPLPYDRPRGAVRSLRGELRRFVLDRPVVDGFKTLAGSTGCDLFTVLTASLQAFFSRYGRQQDVVLTTIAYDRKPEARDVAGCFLDHVVVRAGVPHTTRFGDLVRQTQARLLEASRHRGYPFLRLLEHLDPARRTAVTQIGWSLQTPVLEDDPALCGLLAGHGTARLSYGGLDLEPFFVPQQEGQFDLVVRGYVVGPELVVDLAYDTDLFTASTAASIAAGLQTFLAAAAAAPDATIADIPNLSDEERRCVVELWNQTAAEYPKERCAHELVEAQARRTPEAVALVHGRERMSYKELNARANQLAWKLREMQVGPGTLVAIYLERGLDQVVSLLAVTKAGGAYVPVDPSYPRDRVGYMLEASGAPIVLTSRALLGRLGDLAPRALLLDGWEEQFGACCADDLPPRAVPGSLAYVIFTSGSTGRPKGVMLEHRGLINLITWHQRFYQVTAEDRATQVASLGFDGSVAEIWAHLSAGASVHLITDQARETPASLVRWWLEQEITISYLPTPLAEMVLREPLPRNLKLRALLVGGDKLRAGSWKGLPFKLFNQYGPTEDTVWDTSYEVPPEEQSEPSIGRPRSNTQCYILDAAHRPAGVGVAGELYVAGDGLARGYLNAPTQTAERFIPDPFSLQPGARMYRTGDLARYSADGSIQFLGRLDHQVKVRGFRIELGEIEVVLGQCPGVGDVVVSVRDGLAGERRLVAYVVAQSGCHLAPAELRRQLKEKLPDYMVPAHFVEMPALPLTPNGKVDRKALPAPSDTSIEASERYVEPSDEIERRVCGLIAKQLGLRRVGARDNYFDLGGSSISALSLVREIEKALGRTIAMNSILRDPTPAAIARLVREGPGNALEAALVPLQTKGERIPFFCVHAEGGNVLPLMDLGHQIGRERPFYAVQDPALAGLDPVQSIEEMADSYLRAIRAVQPTGPYLLGGYCFGGTVAWLMAQKLLAVGERTLLVVMIDTPLPRESSVEERGINALRIEVMRKIETVKVLVQQVKEWVSEEILIRLAKRRASREKAGIVADGLSSRVEMKLFKQLLTSTVLGRVLPDDSWEYLLYLPEVTRMMTLASHHDQLFAQHRVSPYEGDALFVMAEQRMAMTSGQDDGLLGYRPHIKGRFERHIVKCDHFSLWRRPHVQVVAGHVSAALDAAERGQFSVSASSAPEALRPEALAG